MLLQTLAGSLYVLGIFFKSCFFEHAHPELIENCRQCCEHLLGLVNFWIFESATPLYIMLRGEIVSALHVLGTDKVTKMKEKNH